MVTELLLCVNNFGIGGGGRYIGNFIFYKKRIMKTKIIAAITAAVVISGGALMVNAKNAENKTISDQAVASEGS